MNFTVEVGNHLEFPVSLVCEIIFAKKCDPDQASVKICELPQCRGVYNIYVKKNLVIKKNMLPK